MKSLSILVIAALSALLVSFKTPAKFADPSLSIEGLSVNGQPPASFTANQATCKIITQDGGTKVMQIDAALPGGNKIKMFFFSVISSTGTVKCEGYRGDGNIEFNTWQNAKFSTGYEPLSGPGGKGEVNVTALTANHIEGTFSGMLYGNKGKTSITGGKFSLDIQ